MIAWWYDGDDRVAWCTSYWMLSSPPHTHPPTHPPYPPCVSLSTYDEMRKLQLEIAWWLRDDMMVMIEWHDVRRTECYDPPHPPTPPRTRPAYLCQRMMKCVSSRLHDDGMMIAWWNDGDDMIACQRMMKCVWWKWARLHGRFSGRQPKTTKPEQHLGMHVEIISSSFKGIMPSNLETWTRCHLRSWRRV